MEHDSAEPLAAMSETGDEPVFSNPSLDRLPLRLRDYFWLLLLVILSDVTLFHGEGYAGLAAFFVGSCLLMLPMRTETRSIRGLVLFGVMLDLLAFKLIWCGSEVQILMGLVLMTLFAMSLNRIGPYFTHFFFFLVALIPAGISSLGSSSPKLEIPEQPITRSRVASVLFPLGALLLFGVLFIFANPDLNDWIGTQLTQFGEWIQEAFRGWFPTPVQVIFWLTMLVLFVGAVRPLKMDFLPNDWEKEAASDEEEISAEPEPLYTGWFNTLVAVIALFAAYLVFEFKTLWFRSFPEGFHYSGYAHEGAFWLTVALALATVTLSLIFRGSLLSDSRLVKLKRLAMIWSALNFLLALAVYHRLTIYVGFNGMTRMRVVGYLGVTAVVIGFVMVLIKIARSQSFLWLVRRQVWVLGMALFVGVLLPVDLLVMRYNTARILAGDPAPSVQISQHPIDNLGLQELVPLLESDNQLIREGVRALLLKEYQDVSRALSSQQKLGWTAWQGADVQLEKTLAGRKEQLDTFTDEAAREQAWVTFHEYAYQWY